MANRVPSEQEVLGYFQSLSNWGRWGEDDQLGTINYITPEKRLKAASLVKEGVTVTCARPIKAEITPETSSVPPLHFMVESGEGWDSGNKLTTRPRGSQVALDFFGMIFHGHSITHLDSLAHFFWNGRMYNGRPAHLVSTQLGATVESIDLLKDGIVTRGVLLDVPRVRGTRWIEPGDGAYREDLEAAEKAQGVRVEEGDVVLIRTGQYRRRNELGPWNPRTQGSAGPHASCLPWLHERRVAVLGSDTGNDVFPPPYQAFTNPIHQVGIVAMGLWILDNANLEDLARACEERGRWEFLITIGTLRLERATGSPCNPIAVF